MLGLTAALGGRREVGTWLDGAGRALLAPVSPVRHSCLIRGR
jgi:hypothetical protein